jgi:glycosyltransferase involved in cell wall biosynthesis
MKICNLPTITKARRVIGGVMQASTTHALAMMAKYHDVEFVDDEEEADVIVTHANERARTRDSDVFYSHGFYPTFYPGWPAHYDKINAGIMDTMMRARAVIVVSDWTAEIMRRDFHIQPHVVRNGIDVSKMHHAGDKYGFILWPKLGINPVCDPAPVKWLAGKCRDLQFCSVQELGGKVKSLGRMKHPAFLKALKDCSILLTTTKENNSVGTAESMAMGIPTVGFNWGHNNECLVNGVGCELVEPGDLDALPEALYKVLRHWKDYSHDAREYAKKNFGIDYTIDTLYKIYKGLLIPAEENRISVVITLHNYARFVDRAIRSVLDQTEPPYEVIVVDDASTDKPEKILDKYRSRVKIIRLKENVGVAEARNIGINAATGNLIASLDADDSYTLDYLERALPEFDDRRVGIVYGFLDLVRDNGERMNAAFFRHEFDFAKFIDRLNQIPTCCVFRKEAWRRAGGYRKYNSPSEDADMWFRITGQGWEVKYLGDEKPISLHNCHDGSLTQTMKRTQWQNEKEWAKRSSALGFPLRNYDLPLVSFILEYRLKNEQEFIRTLDSIEGLTETGWEICVSGVPTPRILAGWPFVRWNVDPTAPTQVFIEAGEVMTDAEWSTIMERREFPK